MYINIYTRTHTLFIYICVCTPVSFANSQNKISISTQYKSIYHKNFK